MPVSVILDCLAAGMTAKGITAEYPTVTVAGVRAAGAYGAALACGICSHRRCTQCSSRRFWLKPDPSMQRDILLLTEAADLI